MIPAFSLLRGLVLLRRIARAAEDIEHSQRILSSIAAQDFEDRKVKAKARKPKPTEFGTLDIAEVNKRWHARQEGEWQQP